MSTDPQTTEQGEWVLVGHNGKHVVELNDLQIVFVRKRMNFYRTLDIADAVENRTESMEVSAYPDVVKAAAIALVYIEAHIHANVALGVADEPELLEDHQKVRTALAAVHPAEGGKT